jgi:hypothetical protein
MQCRIIDLVIDPAHFPPGETPLPSVLISASGHCFIPASPDDRHLGGAHKDSSMLIQLVLGPWSFKELTVGFPYMLYFDPKKKRHDNQQGYDDVMETMKKNYYILGGLPRYLVNPRASVRQGEITSEYANLHAQTLLDALRQGKDFSDLSTDKILTRFFTLRAGDDANGYNPDRTFATLDFVSPGAAKAAGRVILDKIHRDTVWRNSEDASDIGLAFERAVLIFLSQGIEGMERLGIRTRCRQLVYYGGAGAKSAAGKSNDKISFVLHASSDKIEEAPNSVDFENNVSRSGKGVTYTKARKKYLGMGLTKPTITKLESTKPMLLPPDGYCNVDGMAGSDLGLQPTLQKTHTVSGPEYLRQRQAFGLEPKDDFALVFVVPPPSI